MFLDVARPTVIAIGSILAYVPIAVQAAVVTFTVKREAACVKAQFVYTAAALWIAHAAVEAVRAVLTHRPIVPRSPVVALAVVGEHAEVGADALVNDAIIGNQGIDSDGLTQGPILVLQRLHVENQSVLAGEELRRLTRNYLSDRTRGRLQVFRRHDPVHVPVNSPRIPILHGARPAGVDHRYSIDMNRRCEVVEEDQEYLRLPRDGVFVHELVGLIDEGVRIGGRVRRGPGVGLGGFSIPGRLNRVCLKRCGVKSVVVHPQESGVTPLRGPTVHDPVRLSAIVIPDYCHGVGGMHLALHKEVAAAPVDIAAHNVHEVIV